MLYTDKITIPANTSKDSPVRKRITINEDTIVSITFYFPPGHECLTGASVWYGNLQIFPSTEGDWVRGHDSLITGELLWITPETPCEIEIRAFNEDTTYKHTIYFYINTAPSWYVFSPLYLQQMVSILSDIAQVFRQPVRKIERRW